MWYLAIQAETFTCLEINYEWLVCFLESAEQHLNSSALYSSTACIIKVRFFPSMDYYCVNIGAKNNSSDTHSIHPLLM